MYRSSQIAICLAVVGLFGCSQEKNTIVNRSYHNLTSHYNGFFNGRLALQDAHRKMKEGHQEDYAALLPIFIYDKDEVVQPVYPDLDRAIAKTSLVVDRHSMDIQGQEYCKWIDDTWVVMGEAQFLKGELTQAKQIFDFAKRKYDDPAIKQLSLFWSARILAEQEQYSRAGDELRKVSFEEGFPENMLGDLYAFKADMQLKQGRIVNAIEELERSVAATKKRQDKTRRMFILAQLYKMDGDGIRSSQLYNEIIDRHPEYEMAFYAKINLALAYDVSAGGVQSVRDILLKMMRDEKNAEFLDQIYYALAELDLKEGNEPAAIENLVLATRKSVRNGNAKGLAFYKLGEIYFNKSNYPIAQAYYDSTVNFLSPEHPDYDQILARSTSLTQLMRDITVVEREDSLQAFAKLPPEEQEERIDEIIEDLIQAEQDAQRRKELEQLQAQSAQFDQGSEINRNISKGEWYFYNPAAVGFGASEFKKIWGQRKNEDNWRRSDKTSELPDIESELGAEALAEDTIDGANDPKNPNYYWKTVPDSEEKLARSNALIIEALYDLALVYKEQMSDDAMAIATFEDLISRYDSSKYHPNCYYQLYLMYTAQNNATKADFYKARLIQEYPETDYAKVILNPDYATESVASAAEARTAYETAYAYFDQGAYHRAYDYVKAGLTQFPGSPYQPQFRLLEALCLGFLESESRMIAELENIASVYGNLEVGAEARSILEYFRNGRQIENTTEVMNDQLAEEAIEKSKSLYKYDIGASHNFVLIVPDTANLSQLQTIVSDFNRKYFSTRGFKTSQIMLNDGKAMIIVSNIGIASKATDYMGTFKNAGEDTEPIHKRSYPFFVISYDNYAQFYKDQNVEAYNAFFTESYLKEN